jgi:hypothetical protein
MPRFVTISPTHIGGHKRKTWDRFRTGNYIAIGWLSDIDLSGWSDEAIVAEVEERREDGWESARRHLPRFVNNLSIDDIVAVTNAGASILGIGKITSGYTFDKSPHDKGDEEDRYSHLHSVRWLSTKEWYRKDLIKEDEVGWEPRGTLGKILDEVPVYIWRALGAEAVASVEITEAPREDAGNFETRSGQGFQSSPERRKAIERFAIRCAKDHYEKLDFSVTEVGKPYDLKCERALETVLVEVKGTETNGDFILLTRNEVELSRGHLMELFVVSEIQTNLKTDGDWVCSGGQIRVINPWSAEADRLEPYAFIYRLA